MMQITFYDYEESRHRHIIDEEKTCSCGVSSLPRAPPAFQCFLSWSMAVFSRSLDTTIWNRAGLTNDKILLYGTYQHDPDEEESVADEKEKVVSAEAEIVNKKATEAKAIADDAEADLAAAKPELEAAQIALQ